MGTLFVAVTVWLALWGYAISSFCLLYFPSGQKRDVARWAWSLGALLFVIHVAAAFDVYHDWSHAAAMAHVAQETQRVMGNAVGSGIYVSYFYTLLWALDALYWWLAGHQKYFSIWPGLHKLKHAFMFFIFFNGTVIFETWRVKVFGVLVTLALLWAPWHRWQAQRGSKSGGQTA